MSEIEKGEALSFYMSELGISESRPRRLKLSAVTCTGDRPESFKLCVEYMSRQTMKPDEWVIVDDGLVQTVSAFDCDKSGVASIKIIRREPMASDPQHTLSVNMITALSEVSGDRVVVIEDDDWYSGDFIERVTKPLDAVDLCGIEAIVYYHVGVLGYRLVGQKMKHSSLCQTAFNKSVIPTIIDLCLNGTDPRIKTDGLIDINLWPAWKGSKLLLSHSDLVVGIKGVPGRVGKTSGHVDKGQYTADKGMTHLKSLIGNDYRRYMKMMDKKKSGAQKTAMMDVSGATDLTSEIMKKCAKTKSDNMKAMTDHPQMPSESAHMGC